ncbi:MAG: tetratricopeptide repeat protein [Alphaproteobacteria bacterium]|nr:tetratricopeptide repeat protein [Alphaproteobacteria bacterium]
MKVKILFMKAPQIFFAQEFYEQHLSTINNVHFTNREIDVISCLLNARGTGKIAVLLSIDKRTVETHIRNIMAKIDCNSREAIIDFVEVSVKFDFLRKYYIILQNELLFEKSLKDVGKLKRDKAPRCFLIQEKDKDLFTLKFTSHLRLAGIEISRTTHEKKGEYTLFVLSQSPGDEISSSLLKKVTKSQNKVLLLQQGKINLKGAPPELLKYDTINFGKQDNYFFSLFIVLKELLPNLDLEKITEEFKNHYKKGTPRDSMRQTSLEEVHKKFPSVPQGWAYVVSACVLIALLGSGLFVFYDNSNEKSFIRSDLKVPKESALLNRPELMSQIDKTFRKQNKGIQTVAIVGIGGAGKTTLARRYAKLQKGAVIWEINGETPIGLTKSFGNLAYALATTDEDKGALLGLNEIKNSSEREKRIIDFVKSGLKLHPNWFLIYDNVEKFSDIQKYYPQDSESWGQGRVMLTTRDATLQNHEQIGHIIFVGELGNAQKLNLFTQIMGDRANDPLPSAQLNETITFLEKIPPFPLDVSVAAYYLKTTNVPYADYLAHLDRCDKNFTIVQENLLKGAGEYTKTRHGIISLSLEQIMNIHKDFADLLLFISLLDSQHIPRELLDNYKEKLIVDNFIYHLKKYSLISDDTSSSLGSVFSMHRNTQDIVFANLTDSLKIDQGSQLLKKIVYNLDDYADKAIEQEDSVRMQLMASHLEKVLLHSNLLTEFSKALLESKLGVIYYAINNDNSHQLLNNSLKELPLERLHAENASRLARALLPLGVVYTELRFDEKAKEALEKAVQIYGKGGSENYLDLSRALSYLGDLHKRLGNYEEAKGYLEESIHLHKQYGTDSKHIIRTLAYLGSVYRGLGLYQKAIDTLRESLAIYEKNYSNDHIRIGWILIHLGNVHRRLGNLKQAKDTLERGLIIFQKHFPENHVSMGLVWAYLGGYYREVGDYEKSCNYLEHSLRIHQKHFHESHVKMGWILFHLASTYKAMGNNKAQKLFDKVHEIYVTHCDGDNIETARILRNMAKICIEKNRLAEAENYIHRSLKILQSRQHVEAYRALKTLGEILLKKSAQSPNNIQESHDLKNQAIDKFNQALKIAEQHFPKDSVHIQKIHARVKNIQN